MTAQSRPASGAGRNEGEKFTSGASQDVADYDGVAVRMTVAGVIHDRQLCVNGSLVAVPPGAVIEPLPRLMRCAHERTVSS